MRKNNMRLAGPYNSGAAVGGDGVATANTTNTSVLVGRIQGIYIKYNHSPPAGTTDVTVKTLGTSPYPPTYDIEVVSNAATDGWFYPRVLVHDTAGATIAGEYTPLLIHDLVNVTIAQANAADNVDVWILLDDYSTEQ
jgi:hypothetical protein